MNNPVSHRRYSQGSLLPAPVSLLYLHSAHGHRVMQSYAKKDYRLSYLRTKDGVEIDLIVERPGLKRLTADIPNAEAFCLSLDPMPKKIEGVSCLPWERGLAELGL